MADFHRNSRDGNIPGISQTQSTVTVNGDSLLLDNSQQIDETILNGFDKLAGQQAYNGRINWLGSSYSGADIKVVAHLYETASLKQEMDMLKEQKDIYEAVENGAYRLMYAIATLQGTLDPSRGLTFTEKRQAFVNLTGLNAQEPSEQKAISFLVGAIFNSNEYNFVRVANLRTRLQHLHQDFKQRAVSVRDQIRDLQAIQNEAQATLSLGTLQTLSLQTHREKFGVRALGHSYVKGYTRGPRTIAGSMIFTVFNEHALAPLIRAMGRRESIWKDPEIATLLPDQLPPIDLTVAFANEYGSLSEMRMFGVEFVNDGMTLSIEDLLTEEVINFVARDCDVMTRLGRIRLSRLQRGMMNPAETEKTASSLLFSNQRYNGYLDRLGVRRRRFNR